MNIIINADIEEALLPVGIESFASEHSPLLHLMQCLGFSHMQAPVADFLRQLHRLEGEWLVCDPIFWEASHNDAMIVADGNMLQLTEAESRFIFTELTKFLAPEGLELYYHNAYTWLIKVDGKAKPRAYHTYLMLFQCMMSALKEMDSTLYWQKLMTEVQMFLYTLPSTRRDASKAFVNGVWIYGGQSFCFKENQKVFTDDAQMLAAFPDHMKPLALLTQVTWDKDAIVLLMHYHPHQFPLLLTKTGNQTTHWFWNNKTYITLKKRWWHIFKGVR